MNADSPPRIAPVVALDIGNVCYRLQFDVAARGLGYPSMAALEAELPELMDWSRLFETGHVTEATFMAEFAERSRTDLRGSALVDAWNRIIGPEIPEMAEVIGEMRAAGLTVVFFSDIGPIHHRYVDATLSFRAAITGQVMSYRVGALKPDPAMYAAMESDHCDGGVPCLYTDDKPGNIAGARARGWHSYPFGTPTGLRAALAIALDRLATQG